MLVPPGMVGRFLALTALMAGPGIVAVLVLAGFSGWRGPPVAMALFLIVAGAMLVAAIYLRDQFTLARYVRGLGPTAGDRERPPRTIGEAGRRLAGMIAKLQHRWRRHDRIQARRLDDARSIMEAIGDPLLVLTADRAVASANGAALRLFGARIEGRDLANVLRQPEVLTAVDQVLAGGDPKTVAYTSPVPVERVFEAHISPFSSEADAGRGDPADPAVLISLHDITKIKRAEQMRADFVANASHELRTPLSALSGFIETLSGPAPRRSRRPRPLPGDHGTADRADVPPGARPAVAVAYRAGRAHAAAGPLRPAPHHRRGARGAGDQGEGPADDHRRRRSRRSAGRARRSGIS